MQLINVRAEIWTTFSVVEAREEGALVGRRYRVGKSRFIAGSAQNTVNKTVVIINNLHVFFHTHNCKPAFVHPCTLSFEQPGAEGPQVNLILCITKRRGLGNGNGRAWLKGWEQAGETCMEPSVFPLKDVRKAWTKALDSKMEGRGWGGEILR